MYSRMKLDELAQTSVWTIVYLDLGLILHGHSWAKSQHQSPLLKTFPIIFYKRYEGKYHTGLGTTLFLLT